MYRTSYFILKYISNTGKGKEFMEWIILKTLWGGSSDRN